MLTTDAMITGIDRSNEKRVCAHIMAFESDRTCQECLSQPRSDVTQRKAILEGAGCSNARRLTILAGREEVVRLRQKPDWSGDSGMSACTREGVYMVRGCVWVLDDLP